MPEPEIAEATIKKKTITILGIEIERSISLAPLTYLIIGLFGFVWVSFGFIDRITRAPDDLTKFRAEVEAGKTATVDKINNTKAEVLGKLDDAQRDQTRQNAAILSAIANLPDIRATLQQIDRWRDQVDKRDDAQDRRIDQIQDTTAQNKSDMVGVLRALAGAPRDSHR